MAKEDQVREAAYFVWLNNGCPEGVEIDCWLEAEAQEDGCCCEEDCCCEEKAEEKNRLKKPPLKNNTRTFLKKRLGSFLSAVFYL